MVIIPLREGIIPCLGRIISFLRIHSTYY